MEDNNTVERKICKSCGALKKLEHFTKCKTCVGGYRLSCRHCVGQVVSVQKKIKRKENKGYNDFLAMSGVGKESYIEMYLFFQRIGYDLTKPIAEQFAEKHNLKLKKRCQHKVNRYNPKSLGLI